MKHSESPNARKLMIERANHALRLARTERNLCYAYSARAVYDSFGLKAEIAKADAVIEDLLAIVAAPEQKEQA